MQRSLYMPEQVRRFCFSLVIFGALILFLAACGSNGSSTASGSSSSGGTTPTSSSSSGSGYGGGKYGSGGTTPTPSGSSNSIMTATATVSGKSETVLTNAQGMTLYYRTSDTPPSNVCSGGCASAWPPLVVSGSATPKSSTSLPGKLTVVTDANGSQVEYNGHPLYTFSGDTKPGQTNGEGVGGVWFVAIPSLT